MAHFWRIGVLTNTSKRSTPLHKELIKFKENIGLAENWNN